MASRTFHTDRELRALKPKAEWYDARDRDTPNLYVRVGPPDRKGRFRRTFAMVSRFPGSQHPSRQALGEYDETGKGMTLDGARETARLWRALIQNGYDPRDARGREAEWLTLIRKGRDPREEERRAQDEAAASQLEDEQRASLTFGVAIEDYLKRRVAKQRKGKDVEREIRKELIPRWRDKLVSEISTDDVIAMAKEITDRGAPYQAHNCFGHARTFFNWIRESGQGKKYGLTVSPCYGIKPSKLIGEKKPRQRVLTDDELRAFWRATKRMAYPFGSMFQLLLLTGCRKSEVAEARRRELDIAKSVLVVPPQRFKSDVAHLVPLSADAVAVIEALPEWVGGDFLFSTTSGRKPVSGFSKAKARLDRHMLCILQAMARMRGADPKQVELEPFVNHDDRRTVRTRLAALKIDETVAELVIGHGKKGLARVYNQHEYVDEMREALELWAGRLRSIVEPPPANVVQLAARA